jgi:hypothetical protein
VDDPTHQLSSIILQATGSRGHSPEELAAQATARIISVGMQSHPAIRDQAIAFKAQIQELLTAYMKQAIADDRITLAHRLQQAGHTELLSLLRN